MFTLDSPDPKGIASGLRLSEAGALAGCPRIAGRTVSIRNHPCANQHELPSGSIRKSEAVKPLGL